MVLRRAVLLLLLMLAPGWADQPVMHDLLQFRTCGTVLHIGAHPDDENTQLIAWLVGARHYRTGYLSLTRGDGGQNLLGPEFGAALGVIRTQELLAARRIDGGEQFFTRALDFGYSKDYQQTLTKWDRRAVVADMVRVIRTFRPDILITRFSPLPGTTHGHHTASAVLALEAFKEAGDGAIVDGLSPWQPKRILWDATTPSGQASPNPGDVQVDIGGRDPLSGTAFSDLARLSRSQHKTQGFGNIGAMGDGGPRLETFKLLAGEPAAHDVMDGVDTTWARVPGGAEVGHLTDDLIAHFDPGHPSASVPALLKIHHRLATLQDPMIGDKMRLLDHVIAECAGLTVKTTALHAEVCPGDVVSMTRTAEVHSSFPVDWLTGEKTMHLSPDHPALQDVTVHVPRTQPVSQPYWLRRPQTA
ncbi:MAG TPA: PIG-L family deacetylase, partial [Candidatus Xenobia bacterium]